MAKKSDKISSKARTTKIKTKKSKSRKVRRRHDSVSDEDVLRSLSSDSVFSSEEDHRRSRKVRSRSRSRKDVKGSRKSRKRAYSSDSSDESPEPRAKKRKSNEAKKRKKKKKRNARTSSESRSCLTCETEGVGGDEIESKRDRVRDEKPMREGIDRDKVESGPERRGYRSRSRSLCRDDSESGFQSRERVTAEGYRRRLRSVIVVTEGFNEGGQKEEMTYDHDDYPSYRSNDSEDGEIKGELDNHLQVAEEVRVSDNENKNSVEISSLKDEDLETVLRQKAIENLKRFKGNPQKIAVIGDKEDKK